MTLKYRALIFVFIIIVLAAMGLISCSPGKKLQSAQASLEAIAKAQADHDQQVSAKAVDDFVKNNPCKPAPEINLDSLCSIYYRCPPAQGESSPGADYFTPEVTNNAPAAPKRILVPWEDTRRISLMQDSINAKDKRLAVAAALIDYNWKNQSNEVIGLQEKLREKQRTILVLALVGLSLIAILIFVKR